jgi:hypothetical protein
MDIKEEQMNVRRLEKSLIPMPYGCMTVLGLVVFVLTVLAVSSFAITVAILK